MENITSKAAPGPDSLAWKLGSDWRILLGAGRSLLLQVTHPVVAAGVAQFSNFAADPWKRLVGTLEMYVGGVIFGWPDGSQSAGARLRAIHERIRGVDSRGRSYSALQPDAFHWVHATLLDGIVVTTQHFGKQLDAEELDVLYLEMCEVGRLYGIRAEDMPPDWASFRNYFDGMVETVLEDNPVAHEVLSTLRKAPPPKSVPLLDGIWRTLLWPPAGHTALLTTVGLLPGVLRDRLALSWTRRQELELRAHAAVIRRVVPILPDRIRMHPWAYNAQRRARTESALAAQL
jgi:uncharacterized protein (DUF2236 family)